MNKSLEYRDILEILAKHEVDFIVIGGVCALLNGVPIPTFDLDIIYEQSASNLDRLAAALDELGAYYRFHPRRLRPTAMHLASPGHHLLLTDAGPFDVLGTIVEDMTYQDLEPHSFQLTLGIDHTVKVLTLDKLIDIKEKTGRPKDRLAVVTLRAALEERRKQESAGQEPEIPDTTAPE